jgi:hypothetical protein
MTSKSQSGWENGSRARPSGIVWKCGRGTEISTANLAGRFKIRTEHLKATIKAYLCLNRRNPSRTTVGGE